MDGMRNASDWLQDIVEANRSLIDKITTSDVYGALASGLTQSLVDYEEDAHTGDESGDFLDVNLTLFGAHDDPSWRCNPTNTEFNCSVEDYLYFARGPQMLPLTTVLLVTILFVCIFVTGVLGNVIVCVVIIRQTAMHTATNYYLFSLAVSDLVFLLMGLPYELSLYWHQYPYNLGPAFCKIRALLSEASTYVSVLTIVAFSMERFLAICHPLHLWTMSGLKRAIRIVAILWVLSFLSATPFAIFTKIDYLIYPPDNATILESAFCAMLENPPGFPLWELSLCIFFVIPMVVIMALYCRMGLQIRSRTKHSRALGVLQGSLKSEAKKANSRKAIIRMLAAVVITFFVCWAPFHAQRLMYLYARDWEHYQVLNTWLFSVAGWLYYVSCTINPILYNVMSHRYRIAFRETLCGKRGNYTNNNGFARDQSSFRETTIGGAGGYEHSKASSNSRSSRHRDREREKLVANLKWREEITRNNSVKINHQLERVPTVVVANSTNGRPQCFAATSTSVANRVAAATATATTPAATSSHSFHHHNHDLGTVSEKNETTF